MANVNRKMNWRGVIKEMKENWTRGDLYRRDQETHCALGAIGFVNIEDYNHFANTGQGYSVLENNPVTNEAVNRLAQKLVERPGLWQRLRQYVGSPSMSDEELRGQISPQNLVLSINDQFGKEDIIAALEEIQAEEEAKDKATEGELEVEYHPVAKEEEKETVANPLI